MPTFRHELRSLMVLVAASGVLFALVHASGSVGYFAVVVSHTPIGWAVIPIGAFALARSTGRKVRGRVGRFMVGAIVVLCSIATAYLLWADHRLTHEPELSRDCPYPDAALIALERRFDARYPRAVSFSSRWTKGDWLRSAAEVPVPLGPPVLPGNGDTVPVPRQN